MPRKSKKTRKKRGTRTVGYGRVGQHRKTGQKGRRNAGRHKHLWSYVLRYEPEYFSKRGFHQPRQRKVNTLNVGDLDGLMEKLAAENNLGEKAGVPFLDLGKLGYNKLLGMGKMTKRISIKVQSYSKSAAKKVEAIGGELVTETK